jgi:hypothetical protein
MRLRDDRRIIKEEREDKGKQKSSIEIVKS